jgi:NAD(P)-dependent dehydrogenase (short-subunit alcohol dehydrogenase family)
MGKEWTAADVPDQRGRIAVITGANSGIGFEIAAVLADKGARVVLAVRSISRGEDAAERIRTRSPHADVDVQSLDLTSLDSVRTAACTLKDSYPHVDLLINNAGVAMTPKAITADGFELQFGTNHLGHFALTGLLLSHLLPIAGTRVVTVSSLGHRARATIDFDDLHSERNYDMAAAYGRSKLANLLFTYELQRRLASCGAKTVAVAAHPGSSRSGLLRNSPRWLRATAATFAPLLFQSTAMGSLPTLRAGHRPRRRRWAVLRPSRSGGTARISEASEVVGDVARRTAAAAPMARLRRAHRCYLSRMTPDD